MNYLMKLAVFTSALFSLGIVSALNSSSSAEVVEEIARGQL